MLKFGSRRYCVVASSEAGPEGGWRVKGWFGVGEGGGWVACLLAQGQGWIECLLAQGQSFICPEHTYV